jgi:hypothetical protein
MAKHNVGPKNGMWKGGRSIASNVYVLVRVGVNHHLADVRGYAYEHRVVAEQKLGRRLRSGELIHHVNGIKTDNRPENLEIKPSTWHHLAEHRKPGCKKRRPGEANPIIKCACGCGARFRRYDNGHRPRRFVTGHNTGMRYGR